MGKVNFLFGIMAIGMMIVSGCGGMIYSEEVERAQSEGWPILIHEVGVREALGKARVEGAKAMDVHIEFVNTSNKTVARIMFDVTPYNVDKARVVSMRDGKSEVRLTEMGPYKPGASSFTQYWEKVWFDSSIDSVEITGVLIEYTDGTKERINSREIYDYVIYPETLRSFCCVR